MYGVTGERVRLKAAARSYHRVTQHRQAELCQMYHYYTNHTMHNTIVCCFTLWGSESHTAYQYSDRKQSASPL